MSEPNTRHDSSNHPSHPNAQPSDAASEVRDRKNQPPATPRDRGGAHDTGRTMGGGNSGHGPSDQRSPE